MYWFALVGLGMEKTSRPQGSLEVGMTFSSATEGGLKRLGLMKLLGNGCPFVGSSKVLALPFDWQGADSSTLKSPRSTAGVGTKAMEFGGAVRSRVP